MIKLISSYFGDQNIQSVYRLLITLVFVLTVLIIGGFLFFETENKGMGALTFLMAAAASFAGGGTLGFLFGIPKSGKMMVNPANNTTTPINDYTDNTNLEEISDWITKIIVGISFIKFRTVLAWLNDGALAIAHSLQGTHTSFNFYVFSYAFIVFYFLTGAGLLYLWSRTTLSIILTKMKRLEVDNKALKETVQKMANEPATTTSEDSFSVKELAPVAKSSVAYTPNITFRNETDLLYKTKKIIDKEDLQRGRWGGKSEVQNKTLEAQFVPTSSFSGLCNLTLMVRSIDPNKPLEGEVAFFLHDTFPSQILYTQATNNLAQINISAWEAFVVGARLEDGTELELDLNTVKGFPNNFYWK